ncbi:MAG: roadblock/LC7 domain-containing protein [Bryobacteraceae bacterium]|nr:roadblock/LC7 domain-containing protein [Bryobacteraceae bacterium]
MSRRDRIQQGIDQLRMAVPDLQGVLLATNEGMPLVHSIDEAGDPGQIAALAAAVTSLGRRVTESLDSGSCQEVSVLGSDGQMHLYAAGPKAVLAVLGPAHMNSALVQLAARNAAQQIVQAL